MFRPRSLVVACLLFLLEMAPLHAGDLRIPLPKRSKYTPVQALNRDGVKAVEKHQYDRARKLFYKAYLIDPNDPFTLNNLGYMAELDGDADRARRFYVLAAQLGSDAVIDKANNEQLEGKPVAAVAGQAEDKGIKVTRLNNQAIALLEKDRAPEADLILQKALTLDPRNPFTLNNLGYAKEKEGEINAAYQFYSAAADHRSQEKVEIAINKDWRGQAISDVARDNARKLNRRMREGGDLESRVAILNLRGVSALNRNDRRAGREFLQQAFKLDPNDAFTLNNMGYLAELDGDRETADFYYDRAREANENHEPIAFATSRDVEGKKIGDVADTTDQLVQAQMAAAVEARRRMGGPLQLKHRDNSPVSEPAKPVHVPPPERVSNQNGELLLPAPPPASGQPMPVYREPHPEQPSGGLLMPLPDNEQPATVKEGEHDNGIIMSPPDSEQPPRPNPPPPQSLQRPMGTTAPPNTAAPGPQPATGPAAPSPGPGLLLPPPDQQGPPATPHSSTEVYTPPPASTNPGNFSSPARISDRDRNKPQPKPNAAPPNGAPPKKISDMD